jgi:hypothetical protein
LIGRFSVPIFFLGFWVQLTNSLGSPHTNYWLLLNFEVLNVESYFITLLKPEKARRMTKFKANIEASKMKNFVFVVM